MGRAVARKQDTAVAAPGFSANDFGSVTHDQELSSQDILIPKLLVMQPQSPKVVSGDCDLGDIVDTASWEALGKAERGKNASKSLEFIPFSWNKYWIIKKQDGNRFKTEKLVRVDRSNQNLDPWEKWQGEDGILRERVYLHLFHVLIPGKSFPYVLGFKGSSKKAGDMVVTQMYTINPSIEGEAWQKSAMGCVMKVTPQVVSKEDSTFVVLETAVSRPAEFEEACEALSWYKKVAAGEAQADLSGIGDDDIGNKETGEF